MLVNRKQDWEIYQQPEVPSVKKKYLVKPDIALRVKCLTTVTMIVLAAMFLTACSEAIIRSGYELVQMKLQVIKENELLQLDIAKLKSPQRIQNIATVELGMIMPQNVYFVESIPTNLNLTPEKEKNIVSMVLNRRGQ